MITPYYKNDNITLYKGDCIDILSQLQDIKFDLILTDPPYNMISCEWDQLIPFDKMWNGLNKVIKEHTPIILFSSQPFTTDLINSNRNNFKYQMIWVKNVPTGMSSAKYRPMKYHEEILIFNSDTKSTYNPQLKDRVGKHKECYNYNHYCGKSNHIELEKIKKKYDPNKVNPSTILQFDVVPNRKGKLHPTQKPVKLLEYLINTYSNENDLILDFTSGSGSLGEACMNTNRNCILIEKDEKYCEIQKKDLKIYCKKKIIDYFKKN